MLVACNREDGPGTSHVRSHPLLRVGHRVEAGIGRILTMVALCLLPVVVGARGQTPEQQRPPAEPPGTAQETPTLSEVAALRAELERLRRESEARIAALEARIAELEATAREEAEAAEEPSPADDLEALRAAARAAASQPGAEAPRDPQVPEGATSGRSGDLNRLNPQISVTGNLLAVADNEDREELELQEFELDIQSNLDPFSRMRLTLAIEGEELDIEEGYLRYPSLKGGLDLVAGKFRQQLGNLNRQHLHALPQTSYPLILQRIFGEEGLAQTGVSMRWLLPRPWASANEITFEVTNGENDFFGGELFENLTVLGHLKNFWELDDATYFEWGLSGVAGRTESHGDAQVYGSDLTLHWQPPRRAKYRELTWRTEVLRAQRDDAAGVRHEAWGGYSYVEALLRRNLYLGMRLDRAEDLYVDRARTWGVAPFLTWWQSEFVRIRAELQYLDEESIDPRTRFLLQFSWAAGPHKHETY